MSISAAAKYMGKSRQFVQKRIKRYAESKTVDDLPNRGLVRTTTKRQDKTIIRLFERNPDLTLKKGQEKLAQKNIIISLMTIRRRLLEHGVAWRNTRMKPLLNEKHIEKRLEWAKENLNRDWRDVIFTDEASFWAWVPRRKAWSKRGNPVLQRSIKHPVKLHVWGCFNARGFGILYLFTNTLTAQLMTEIYQKCLLPSAHKWFGRNNDSWILQEDNDPKHCSRICKAWKAENGIRRLSWPSQSPDANPIENVWAFIKHRLQGKRVFTLKQLSRQIKTIWRSLPESYAENLVASMRHRCQAILDNNGDWTVY